MSFYARSYYLVREVTVTAEIFSRMIAQLYEEFKFHPIKIHVYALFICTRAIRDWTHAVTRVTPSSEASGRSERVI